MSKTIVFVHGAWVTPASWDPFRAFFEARGFTTHAPAWPFVAEHSVDEMNNATPAGFGALTLGKIVDRYEAFIRELPEVPIIVGHSFGGLLTQLLIDRGCGVAGVAIDPAPIGGVVPGPSAFAAITPIMLRLFGWRRPYKLSRKRFGKLFAHTAPPALVDEAYASYVIPAPGMIFHQAALWLGSWVDTPGRKQPLLFTGGSEDRLVSPYLSKAAYRAQSRSKARTDYVEFAGRSHFLCAEPGWEEVAGAIADWIATISPAAESNQQVAAA
ncbi:alpha/beta hydrolase [Aurantiacibacter hainanensis]|uniref:alpha/beta hydrolase n=1 Tax=Aurantiacibacter hainanensis TaxID=3076114 RepID=UPI0030C71013